MSEQRRQDELVRLADEQEEVEAAAMEAGSIDGIAPTADPSTGPAIEASSHESDGAQLLEIESVHDAHVNGEPDMPGESARAAPSSPT